MSITTRDDVFLNLAKGKGQHLIGISATPGSLTAATAASGFLVFSIAPNSIGSTLPATNQDFPEGAAPPSALFNTLFAGNVSSSTRHMWLARFYLFGTLNTGGSGNQFTHDAATFPVKRTVFGAASTAIDLIPVIQPVTQSAPPNAVSFILKDTAPSAGYTNQDGTGVTGTKTITLPGSSVVGGCYVPRLEDGDSAVQDVTQIDITSNSGTTSSANVWGVELIAPIMSVVAGFGSLYDGLFGGLGMNNVAPAVATSGTVTSFLGLTNVSTTGSTGYFYQASVLNA